MHLPQHSDEVIGDVDNPPVEAALRYAKLEEFMHSIGRSGSSSGRMSSPGAPAATPVGRCARCATARCVMDKNRPQVVDTSAHLKGTLAFHITRAFHLAGRCVSCGACAQACPAGIDLRLLNMSLAQAAEAEFGFRPGLDPDADPILGVFSTRDREDFIQ